MVDKTALFKLNYGLFVLSSKSGERDAGCIINTAMQVTDSPLRVSVVVNKQNYTHHAIFDSGLFSISVLTRETPFEVFENFGFRSSRDVEKFAPADPVTKSGLRYYDRYANAVISAQLMHSVDLGTHTLFIGNVTEAKVLSEEPSVTYNYYHQHIKPKPEANTDGGKKWVCKICGYIYDEKAGGVPFEELPEDWVCPLCKHPKSDFEPV